MQRQRVNKAAILPLIAIAAAFAFAPTAAPALPSNQCWELTQESCTIGKIELYISERAVRWNSTRLGLTFILRAPDWKLLGFNESTKKYMELTIDQMEQLVNQGKKPKALTKKIDKKLIKDALTPLKDNNTKICGLKTIELHMPKELASQQHGGNGAAAAVPSLGTKIKHYDMKKWRQGDEDTWFASDIQLPAEVADFLLQKMHSSGDTVPGATRHPLLRSVHIGFGGSPAMALDTTDCKKVAVTAKLFELPKGYAKTDNEMALLMGVDDSDMDILGSSSPKKKSF